MDIVDLSTNDRYVKWRVDVIRKSLNGKNNDVLVHCFKGEEEARSVAKFLTDDERKRVKFQFQVEKWASEF